MDRNDALNRGLMNQQYAQSRDMPMQGSMGPPMTDQPSAVELANDLRHAQSTVEALRMRMQAQVPTYAYDTNQWSTKDHLSRYGLKGTVVRGVTEKEPHAEAEAWDTAMNELAAWMQRHKIVSLHGLEPTLDRDKAIAAVDRTLAGDNPVLEQMGKVGTIPRSRATDVGTQVSAPVGTSADAQDAYQRRFRNSPPYGKDEEATPAMQVQQPQGNVPEDIADVLKRVNAAPAEA